MKTYILYVSETVSTAVEIEAESAEEAIDEFYQEGLPHLMFLDHRCPDEGEWEVDYDAVKADYPDEFND